MSGILDDLTPKQREAATQTSPVLVIMGAGTVGHRIAACGTLVATLPPHTPPMAARSG